MGRITRPIFFELSPHPRPRERGMLPRKGDSQDEGVIDKGY